MKATGPVRQGLVAFPCVKNRQTLGVCLFF